MEEQGLIHGAGLDDANISLGFGIFFVSTLQQMHSREWVGHARGSDALNFRETKPLNTPKP